MAGTAKWQSYGLGRWRWHAMPLLVWLASVGGVVWLLGHRAQRFELVGIAQGQQRQIAALTNGRLLMVPVQRFERVSQGQTLAVLADERIQAELATAGAEASRLRAELTAAMTRFAADAELQEAEQMAEARRFAFDVEQTRLDTLELKVVIETDQITFQRRRFELDRLNKLQEQNAVNEYELELAKTKYEALAKKIAENENVLAQSERDMEQAQQRLAAFAQQHPTPADIERLLEPLRQAVTVQELRMAELSLERSMLVLRSPMDGVVNELLRGAGEAVMSGEPILTLAASRPSEVIAYATAAQASRVEPGMAVELQLVRQGAPRRVAESSVQSVGPTIVELPLRLWKSPAVPEWGWPIKIAVSSKLEMLSGERIGVRGM